MNPDDTTASEPTTITAAVAEDNIKKITNLYAATRTAYENWIKISRLSFVTAIAREALTNPPVPARADDHSRIIRAAHLSSLTSAGVLQDKQETAEKNRDTGRQVQSFLTKTYAEQVQNWAEKKQQQANYLLFVASTKEDKELAHMAVRNGYELEQDMIVKMADIHYGSQSTTLDRGKANRLGGETNSLKQWLNDPTNHVESLLQRLQHLMAFQAGTPLDAFSEGTQKEITDWSAALDRLNANPNAAWTALIEKLSSAESLNADLVDLKTQQEIWLKAIRPMKTIEAQWPETIQKQENELASMAPNERESWWNDHVTAIKASVEEHFDWNQIEQSVEVAVATQERQNITMDEMHQLRTALFAEEEAEVRRGFQQPNAFFGSFAPSIDIFEQVSFEMARPQRGMQRERQVREQVATPEAKTRIDNKLAARMADSAVKNMIDAQIEAVKKQAKGKIHLQIERLAMDTPKVINAHQPPLVHLNQLWQQHGPALKQEATTVLEQMFQDEQTKLRQTVTTEALESPLPHNRPSSSIAASLQQSIQTTTRGRSQISSGEPSNISNKQDISPELNKFLEPLAQNAGSTVAECGLVSLTNGPSKHDFQAILLGKSEENTASQKMYFLDEKNKSIIEATRSTLGEGQWKDLEKELNKDNRNPKKMINVSIPKRSRDGQERSPTRGI